MPLPPPVERKLIHRRTVVAQGFERADGGWDVDSSITDVKALGTPLADHPVEAGEIIHGMSLRLTINERLEITEVAAVTDFAPFRMCPAITPNFQRLVGLKLVKGFSKAARAVVGGVQGCVHLVDLIGPAATAALQTMGRSKRLRQQEAESAGATVRPAFINTCHSWATDSEVVKREFPKLYTGS